jgi:hypothetical protein
MMVEMHKIPSFNLDELMVELVLEAIYLKIKQVAHGLAQTE